MNDPLSLVTSQEALELVGNGPRPAIEADRRRLHAAVPAPEEAHAAPPGPFPLKNRILMETRNLVKTYRKGPVAIPVLQGTNLRIVEGQFTAIVGQSGSGKSTLLHLLATLDAPDDGEIFFSGRRIDNLPSRQRDRFRNASIGIIFQFYHLLPELTTIENVLAPCMIAEGPWSYWRRRKTLTTSARRLLDLVGLSHRLHHRPRELSGGELQRAAIARSLILHPRILLADEPTGNLDQETGHEIIRVLQSLNREQNLTIVMVTHDPAIARAADRAVRLVEGRIHQAA